MESNRTYNDDGSSYISISKVNVIDGRYKEDKDLCFKRYPN